MTIRYIDRLLSPSSVVVVGASARPGSVGATVWRNLRSGPFNGPVYGVNPRHTELDGVPIFATLDRLPAVPDLALICTPASTVSALVGQLGQLGTRAAVIITAGLSAEDKRAALSAARPFTLRLLGPNCLGVLSPHIGLNASFAHTDALAGDVAFVSQSGALVTAVLDWTRSHGVGLSHLISLGDHLDVDFGDLLDHLASDARTRSILLYVESIESPRKFMSAARAAARNKPVIVVKAGRAGHGVKAAASHTGALAGSDKVYDAAIRRAGMLRVDTLQELFIAAETLSRFRGNSCATLSIMTNGGGAGVMAADAAAHQGVVLSEPGAALMAQLDAVLPAHWSRANPIDIIGDAPIERYTQTLSALLADESAGAVLFLHAPTAIVRSEDIARACLPLVRANTDRVMSAWLGEDAVAQARRRFQEAGVADYATPEEAVRAFAMLQTYRRNQATLMEMPSAGPTVTPDLAAVQASLDAAMAQGREWLDEQDVRALLAAYGIATVTSATVAATPQAAVEAAHRLGYPVTLKILSPDITHKSDVGGVRLGLDSDVALTDAVNAMLQAVHAARPQARIDGFTLQTMVRRPHAHELIVGASVDPVFGPVLLFGQGGTAVEVIDDTAMALPPLNRALARELVSRTRVAKLLAGYRDRPPAQLDALCDVLVAVSRMQADLPAMAELDINPLWLDEDGALALDARVRLSLAPVSGASRFAILPYPTQWVRECLWDGRKLLIRPIRPEDEMQHRRFLESLAPEDVRLRIFYSRHDLPRSELARLTQIDYDREMAFVAEAADEQGSPQTLGVARALSDPDGVEAEFAIIVRSDLKGRGLGTLLFERLIEHARHRGTCRLVGFVLHENTRMLSLARAMGLRADPGDGSDPGTVRMVLDMKDCPAAAPAARE
ncbi:bifunctional acetate--CoA ligase family protein/GNAT family N-acetyltransferase [Hydrogenophaga sp. BPS33]|uniref:bifunctional acetate--CoA ligase family protein/GNAT family N-acetyltransferase n=1 Tax=Hydrogenophaga sp. BPS33 TaxID=2651974 RepID=UPI00132003D1|nr:bifunctional acetate--CoA ligase family protein/GNAT family N-acetyltransferase [Hydrogenophaga sp. BPS33]QHE86143.1 bifunctional acetate--CoA ligase family protein/GNAT family N-acetyltransferase [Hydrogenophaga sp. BPS33]